jgi:hypothetical protein
VFRDLEENDERDVIEKTLVVFWEGNHAVFLLRTGPETIKTRLFR